MQFITVDEVKAFEGIKSPNEDNNITPLVGAVNRLLTNLTDAENTQFVYSKDSIDPLIMFLPTYGDASSITVNDSAGTPLPGLTGYSGKYTLSNPYIGEVTVLIPPPIDSSNIPEDLKLAALMLVRYYRKEEYKASQSGNGQAVSNVPSVHNVPRHIMAVLSQYRVI